MRPLAVREKPVTARSIHDVLQGLTPKKNRTFQPVRRNSYHRGERENRVWRPIDKKKIGATMRAAESFDRKHKEPGQRNGPLGHVGIEVLRQLLRIVDYRNGRCEPSIDYLMRSIRRSRDAIVRALARLKRHGFVDWIRRTEPTGIEDGTGPRVKQIPNAYWFKLPKVAADMVERLTGKGPPPADAEQRVQDDKEDRQAMLASLTPTEFSYALANDPELAAVLASLGEGVFAQPISASLPSGQNPAEEI